MIGFLSMAGGRRLKALQALCEKGVIDADYKVPCVIDESSEAAELSLAENVMRVAMGAADEFEAFAGLIAAGASEDEVAARFGTTVGHIRKRMKLAAVAPEILDRYRDGTITLETLMAFTLTDSHDRQREVFAAIEPNLRYGGSPVHLGAPPPDRGAGVRPIQASALRRRRGLRGGRWHADP